jgi:hypothetical protein
VTERVHPDASMWSYPDGVGRIDVSGYRVHASDGEIGKVDEATLDAGDSYLIVDTGPWIFGKRVFIPAGLVDRIDRDEECVYLARTKDEISGAPEFDAGRYREAEYRESVGTYYADARAPRDDEPPPARSD